VSVVELSPLTNEIQKALGRWLEFPVVSVVELSPPTNEILFQFIPLFIVDSHSISTSHFYFNFHFLIRYSLFIIRSVPGVFGMMRRRSE